MCDNTGDIVKIVDDYCTALGKRERRYRRLRLCMKLAVIALSLAVLFQLVILVLLHTRG